MKNALKYSGSASAIGAVVLILYIFLSKMRSGTVYAYDAGDVMVWAALAFSVLFAVTGVVLAFGIDDGKGWKKALRILGTVAVIIGAIGIFLVLAEKTLGYSICNQIDDLMNGAFYGHFGSGAAGRRGILMYGTVVLAVFAVIAGLGRNWLSAVMGVFAVIVSIFPFFADGVNTTVTDGCFPLVCTAMVAFFYTLVAIAPSPAKSGAGEEKAPAAAAASAAEEAPAATEEAPAEEPAAEEFVVEAEEAPAPAEEPAAASAAEETPSAEEAPAEEPVVAEEAPAEEPAEEPVAAEEAPVAEAAAAAAVGIAAATEFTDEELGLEPDTPEKLVRRACFNKGLRCRLEYGDEKIHFVFVKAKVAVYIDEGGIDTSPDAKLEEDGWTVFHFEAEKVTDGKDEAEIINAAVKANERALKKKKKK